MPQNLRQEKLKALCKAPLERTIRNASRLSVYLHLALNMFWVCPLFLVIGLLTWSSKANMVDGCVYLDNFDITTALNEELGLTIQDYGNISQCLCVSGIHEFIGTSAPANLAAQETSWNRVASAIAQIIDSAPGYGRCNYPGGSQPACTQNDSCGYTCINGFQRSGDSCVCPSPYYACNGQCSPSLCPSAVASHKRSMDQQTTVGSRLCPFGQTACGGYSGPTSYECIDINTTLDSCGGCIFPLEGQPGGGTDCSEILGVESVQCFMGRCAVMSCKVGWMVTADGQSCTAYKY
jgi:hypothetical protein